MRYPVRPDNYHNVGISSGEVYNGTIGHPRDRRSKLIGACINEAAYLVEKGKEFGSCILISKETKRLLQNFDFNFEEVALADDKAYKVTHKK